MNFALPRFASDFARFVKFVFLSAIVGPPIGGIVIAVGAFPVTLVKSLTQSSSFSNMAIAVFSLPSMIIFAALFSYLFALKSAVCGATLLGLADRFVSPIIGRGGLGAILGAAVTGVILAPNRALLSDGDFFLNEALLVIGGAISGFSCARLGKRFGLIR